MNYQILEIISNCCNLNSILFIWALLPFFFTLLNYQILSDTWTNIELFQPKIHPFHLTTFTTFLNIIELSNTIRYFKQYQIVSTLNPFFHLIVVSKYQMLETISNFLNLKSIFFRVLGLHCEGGGGFDVDAPTIVRGENLWAEKNYLWLFS